MIACALLLAALQLNCARADFDGKTFTFTDQFQITHPMGRLSANRAVLENLELRRSVKKPAELTLKGSVEIEALDAKTPFFLSAKNAFCELHPDSLFPQFQFHEIRFFDQVEIRTLRGLTAKGGSAVYKTGSLILYPAIPNANCHLIWENDRIDAREIRLNLFNEELACVHSKGFIHKGPFQFFANNLIWQKKEGRLELDGDVQIDQEGLFHLEANRGQMICAHEMEPELITLEGKVQMISSYAQEKESFAVADRITYSPVEKTLRFFATAPRKVLFWQDGLSLSAPEILLRCDKKTERHSVEGFGDVHFAFDTEEQDYFEQFFKKYL